MSPDIYSMNLHDKLILSDMIIFRVAGGWLYQFPDKTINCLSTVFVPYSTEFAHR